MPAVQTHRRTGEVGQLAAVLGLTRVTTATFARWTGRRGGVSAGAVASPYGSRALTDEGLGALPPVGPSRPEPVHWTETFYFHIWTCDSGSALTRDATGTFRLADRGLGAQAGTHLSAVLRGGLVTRPDGQLKPLPTGGGALAGRRPRPPAAVHCRTIPVRSFMVKTAGPARCRPTWTVGDLAAVLDLDLIPRAPVACWRGVVRGGGVRAGATACPGGDVDVHQASDA